MPSETPSLPNQIQIDERVETKNRQPAKQADGVMIPDQRITSHATDAGLAATAGYTA